MNKNRILLGIAWVALFVIACGDNAGDNNTSDSLSGTSSVSKTEVSSPGAGIGIGKYSDVPLTDPLDKSLVDDGRKAYDVKCASCHKLTDEMLVGPGWKSVTLRRTPEWIMNFLTNTDEMLDKDAAAISMLEICLVRMPDQNSSDTEARALLEFMRHNDGVENQ